MKYILKQAVSHILPPQILNRKDKMGFPVPFHLWVKKELKDFLNDTILSDNSKQRGIFKVSELESLCSSEKPFGRQLWGILSLELWFQQFIDN